MSLNPQGLKVIAEALAIAAAFYLGDCFFGSSCPERFWLLRGTCSAGFSMTAIFAAAGTAFGLFVALFTRAHPED